MNRIRIRKVLLLSAIALFLFSLPLASSAATDFGFFVPEGGFVPCGRNIDGNAATTLPGEEPCNFCHLFELGQNLLTYILQTYLPLFALIFIFYAGFLLLTSGGNEERVKSARSVISNVFIGLFIALLAWLFVDLMMVTLFREDIAGSWSSFECKVEPRAPSIPPPSLPPPTVAVCADGKDNDEDGKTDFPNDPGCTSATDTEESDVAPPPSPGVQCSQSGINYCAPRTTSCSAPGCGAYSSMIARQARGSISANLLKAIMVNESSCRIGATSGAGACGLMQLKPETARLYARECGVSSAAISCSWLTTSANAEKSICIAAAYLNALARGECDGQVTHVIANYNGGNACKPSVSCAGETSCSGSTVRRWECLYEDTAHTICNSRPGHPGYYETRNYVPKVSYCLQNPGF